MARVGSIKPLKRKKSRFFPEAWAVFFARRIIDGVGAAFFAGGLFLALSFLSYDRSDPSWNTAAPINLENGAAVSNWMGTAGAALADIFLQSFGLAAFILPACLMIWGVRLYLREPVSMLWLRVAAVLAACVFFAILCAPVALDGWLSQPSLGGAGGVLLLQRLSHVFHVYLSAWTVPAVLLVSSTAGFGLFFIATALTGPELATGFQAARRVTTVFLGHMVFLYSKAAAWTRYYNDEDFVNIKKPERPRLKKRDIEGAGDEDGEDPGAFAESESDAAPSIPVVKIGARKAPAQTAQKQLTLHEGAWELPPPSILQSPPKDNKAEHLNEDALRKNAELLQNVLADFSVEGEIVSIHPGPVVTLYEFEPAPGTKSSRIISLSDDIARSMSAVSVRCAVVPGRNVIGIELPNKTRQVVYMEELLTSPVFEKTAAKLPLILGKDIGGQPVLADLARMPHLLVAGTTGSGKSVAVNTMILSLLFNLPPEKCRFIMIDPKMLELSVYDDIPHLLSPVVTEPGKAVVALKWAVREMEDRYRAMSKLGVRNIEGYNERLAEARKKKETIMRKVQTGFDASGKPTFEDQPLDLTELPYIVVIVDEFADLMLVAGKDVESAVQRLAQMARAAGIHLIMATQRPSVDVITGVVKANFPTRISFQVTSKIDSRTILGESGAEQLLGMGDMLYMAPGGRITRVHGPFVADSDVEKVVEFLKAQGTPAYIDNLTESDDFSDSEIMSAMFGGGSGGDAVDEFYDQAVALVAREGKASTSFVQRYLQIGYNRAARIIEEMERQGVISKANAVGKREVLVRDVSEL